MPILDMSTVQMLKTMHGFLREVDSVLATDYITYFQLSAIKSDIQSYIRNIKRETNISGEINTSLITLYNNMIDTQASKSKKSNNIFKNMFGTKSSKSEHHHDPVFCKKEILKIKEEIEQIIEKYSRVDSERFSSNSG